MQDIPATSWLDPRLDARASDVEGQGLFARSAIAAGEVLVRLGGRILNEVEMQVVVSTGRRYSALRIGQDRHLLMDWSDPASRGNHSCDPNAWLADGPTIIARRDIAAGEEVTTDYGTMTVDTDWQMPCACGAATCRHVVTGEDWRLPALREAYAGHFIPWIESLDHAAP